MTRTWDNQFEISEERPLHVPQFLLEAPFVDESWGNEIAPRFSDNERKITVLVDYDNPQDREWDDGNKYSVLQLVGPELAEIGESLYSTDSEEELKQYLETYHPAE